MLAARAWIYYAQEKFDESVKYALQAIERKANCEGAYDVLGRAYFSLGRWQDAAALVDRAVEMNGDDYNLYVPYLNALGALGDQEALWRLRVKEMKVLEQQPEMAPEDMRARMLLAVDYAGLNRETEAIRELQKAVALRPNDGNTLSCVYGILKKKAEAMDHLKRAKDSGYSHMTGRRRIRTSDSCMTTRTSRNWLVPAPPDLFPRLFLLRGRRQQSVQAQVDGGCTVVVGPVIAQLDQCGGAARLLPAP